MLVNVSLAPLAVVAFLASVPLLSPFPVDIK